MLGTICLFFVVVTLKGGDDTVPFTEIKNGDISAVKEFFKDHDINGVYGDQKLTPLTFAIQQDQFKVAKLLIKLGADVNQLCQDKTPLIHTTKDSNLKIVKYLLKKGAAINDTTLLGNTAMIYTAYQGSLEMAKFLVDNGIEYNKQNGAGKTALDYANDFNNRPVGDFLRSIHARSIATSYPDYLDGPHLVWVDDNDAFIFYLKRDSAKDETMHLKRELVVDSSPYSFRGIGEDTSEYTIIKEKSRPPDSFKNVRNILTIGDIHGGYDSLILFLKNNKVVDKDLNWAWGDGHLVFLGDIFDRGEKVTECLWLIYKLEHQAYEQGGRIHLILGNHEMLIIHEEIKDISVKYSYLTYYVDINYWDFYDENTEFGRWLMHHNLALKIDDKLFIHAGISPEFLNRDLDLESMNEYMDLYFTGRIDSSHAESVRFLLWDSMGPIWYRGYLSKGENYPRIQESEIDRALEHFNVSKIIVGHTNVEKIQSFYNKKVYATDIPFYLPNITFQALLIEDDKYFRLFSDGRRERIE